MKKVTIIGSGLYPIHLKHCIDIIINDEKNTNEKKLKMSFEFLGATSESTREAINKFVESMKQANFNKSFEPESSKFMSKPKNNFKKTIIIKAEPEKLTSREKIKNINHATSKSKIRMRRDSR